MKKLLSQIFLCFLLTATMSPCLAAETGWVLLQRTPIGMYNVYIAKNAVRIDEVKTNYSIVSKAPDWNVYAFRKDKKTIFKQSPKKWLVEGLFTMNERTLVRKLGPKTKKKEKVISNFKYLEYEVPHIQSRRYSKGKIIDLTGFMSNERNVKKITSTHANLLVSPMISTNPDIARTLGSLFVVPIGSGAPIKFTIKYDNGFQHNPLLTSRVRKIKLSESLFKVPTGYKKLNSIQSITTGHRASEIDNMIIDLGLGDSFGQKKKNKKSR